MTLPAIARFGLVGLAQNALNVATFAAALEGGVPYRAAAVLAAILALLVSFALHRLWTFRVSTRGALAGHAFRYTIVFTLSVAAGVVILSVLVERAGFASVPAQVVAIAIVAPASFLAQRGWVFA